jgi:hypothetical protein
MSLEDSRTPLSYDDAGLRMNQAARGRLKANKCEFSLPNFWAIRRLKQ